MARRRLGDKPLSEPMMVSLLTHICMCHSALKWDKKSACISDDLHIEDGSLSIPEGFFIELHDIKDDPEEANDLSSDYPEVVTSLLQRLMSYKEHQVESRTYCLDPKADPLFHSGYWVPWLEEGTEPVDPLYCLEEQEITENVQDSRYVLNEDFYSRNYGWIAGLCIIGGIVIVIAVLPMVAFIRNRHRARRGYEMM